MEHDGRGGNGSIDRLVGFARRLYGHRLAGSVTAIAAASALCIAMLSVRLAYTGSGQYRFLVWNLFLAWIPFLFSVRLYTLKRRGPLAVLALGGLWLLFFPNAPYIITDLVHIRRHDAAPIWFDVIMVSAFAGTGLALGIISLRFMQSLVRQRFGNIVSWGFVSAVLTTASFGVYLGRFERWNSWDVVTNPRDLGHDIAHTLLHPLTFPRTYAVTLLFAALLTAAYVMATSMPTLGPERPQR